MQGKLLLQLETRTSNSLPVMGVPVESKTNSITQLENHRRHYPRVFIFSRRLRCEQTTYYTYIPYIYKKKGNHQLLLFVCERDGCLPANLPSWSLLLFIFSFTGYRGQGQTDQSAANVQARFPFPTLPLSQKSTGLNFGCRLLPFLQHHFTFFFFFPLSR